MKNFEIYAITNAYKHLAEVSQTNQNGSEIKLPAKVAWIRRVNMDKLFKAQAIIDEALNDISKKYSDDEHSTDENGNRRVKDEFINDYANERAEIFDQDTDIEIKKVKIEELGDVMLSDEYMDTVMFMIEE